MLLLGGVFYFFFYTRAACFFAYLSCIDVRLSDPFFFFVLSVIRCLLVLSGFLVGCFLVSVVLLFCLLFVCVRVFFDLLIKFSMGG